MVLKHKQLYYSIGYNNQKTLRLELICVGHAKAPTFILASCIFIKPHQRKLTQIQHTAHRLVMDCGLH